MKKCPKCGSRIREGSAFCVNCGARLSRGKYAKKSSRKPHKLLLVMVTLIVIVAMITICILFQRNIRKNVSLATEREVTIIVPDDLSIDPENVCFEDSKLFADSQLTLTAIANTDYSVIEELVKTENGEIIGYISFSEDYQIKFREKKSYQELTSIIEAWEEKDFVETVMLNQVLKVSSSTVTYSNDPWENTSTGNNTILQWSETNIHGNNWWAETICMPSVWAMDIWDKKTSESLRIGVIDSVFDCTNQDLDDVIIKTWQNEGDHSQLSEKELTHGTHVAGIIAAEINNGVGIAGVASCIDPELYGFSMAGNTSKTYISWMDWKYAMALMFEQGVKVINISMGPYDELIYAAERGNVEARTAIEQYDNYFSEFLEKAINAGYDFLIVKAGGNTGGYLLEECEVSKEYPYGYRYVLDEEGNPIQGKYERCSAKYALLGGINNRAVKDRIIIVGASDKPRNSLNICPAAWFSAYGCDVYAPGISILSTIPGTNSTGEKSGTSMSTPIVTGIAALVWEANPELSASQVKDIISRSAPLVNGQHGNLEEYSVEVPIVNAAVAVYFARNYTGFDLDKEITNDSLLMGSVYEITKSGDEEEFSGIENATISIWDHSNSLVYEKVHTNSTGGGFEMYLPAGEYSVAVEAEGFIKHTTSFVLEKNEVAYLSIELHPEEFVGRKLTQINYYEDYLCRQENLKYNENGLLTHHTSDYYSTSGEYHYSYTFSYNDHGQLIQSIETNKGYPCTKYEYNPNGQMMGWSQWEYSTTDGEEKYICEYNAAGQKIRDISADGSNETVYTYDSNGRMVSKNSRHVYGDMSGTTDVAMSYDNEGNLSEQTVISDWGFGEPSVETYVYDYNHKPFTAVSTYSNGSLMSSSLNYEFYKHNTSDESVSFTFDESAKFEFQDGYLIRVTGSDYTYEFFYDGETDESFTSKIPARRYEDEITGDYISEHTDVKIKITATNDSDYHLTYTASGVTLENIPLAYFNENTATSKMIMFDVDASYPEYSGYVEFVWDGDWSYGFNALIDGLTGTEGDYYPLKKVGVFIPAN